MSTLTLGNSRIIGKSQPVYIVAEIGLCHNGDLNIARGLIKSSVEAGVDAVKFQKRDVANLAIHKLLNAPDNRYPLFGSTYRQIREHIEFDLDAISELKDYAKTLGVDFFASVFDIKSASQMAELAIPALKLASHSLSDIPLIEHIAELGIPVLLSTGMAYLEEIDQTAKIFNQADLPFGLFHCVSIYPHKADKANLKVIRLLEERYGVPVGYSCHEFEDTSSLLAVAAGAVSIERHVTFDRNATGFDHKFALDIPALEKFVNDIRITECTMGDGEKTVSEEEWTTREKYHRSVVSKHAIQKGETITREMLITKNPGTGIHASKIDRVVGRIAAIDIPEDTLMSYDMLSE